ncbi:hypothetical protein ADEAN_000297400 [Angomonas deanei]|uniref:Uncharacterized protein n=1 Tax=Angomonas deanei TaxID=59799 RepID=A0A7G2C7G1_9TRYP|nr:hypothetical protein ADEAN_000297400 [Angomonas deanei]
MSGKRKRTDPNDGENSEEEYIETIEEVTYTYPILLRFPCFDYFKTVHLCEKKEREEAVFSGDSVEVDLPSLETSSPKVSVRTGAGVEKRFAGHWESAAVDGRTNCAVVALHWSEDGVAPSGEAQGGVRSLFPHAKEGLSSDEVRKWREKMLHRDVWRYASVDVPSAVLVLEPVLDPVTD